MEIQISTLDKIRIFSKFIGQKIWLRSLQGYLYEKEPEHQFGILTGVKTNALQVKIANEQFWIHQGDEFVYYDIRLLLKPLFNQTTDIMTTANDLPITVFITQYYTHLGFDMPVFIEPGA